MLLKALDAVQLLTNRLLVPPLRGTNESSKHPRDRHSREHQYRSHDLKRISTSIPQSKDEGGRMKDEVKASRQAFLSSFILPPSSLLFSPLMAYLSVIPI
jgi:hypothetical protein